MHLNFPIRNLMTKSLAGALALAGLAAILLAPSASAAPIANAGEAPSLLDFSGKAFKATPVAGATKAPRMHFTLFTGKTVGGNLMASP